MDVYRLGALVWRRCRRVAEWPLRRMGWKQGPAPRVAAAAGRRFKSALSAAALDAIQHGAVRSVYRGVPFLKDPFDIGLYLQLVSRLRPRSLIEIGTKHGGSALFFADLMTAHGVEARVLSIDIEPSAEFSDPRITFLEGDARSLDEALPESVLASLARPLMVVEDSSHHYESSTAVLEFFDEWLVSGEYIVIEDGIVSQFSSEAYDVYEDGPNRAVADFLARHPGRYDIDEGLCDHYGYNVTFNPNGWLRRR